MPGPSPQTVPRSYISRVKSGIPGLDKLIEGGFVKNSVNLLTGETGTGKTIFGSQFLWEGLKAGEPGLYITLEEGPDELRRDVKQFGWDFPKYEKKGLCQIVYYDPAQTANIASAIMSEIESMKAQRLVIDSTSVLGLTLEQPMLIRRKLLGLINAIKRNQNCTGLLITEIPEESKALSRFGVEEFVADSVTVLNYLGIGQETMRSLIVRKMRRTNHGKDVYPLVIGTKGIVVKKVEI